MEIRTTAVKLLEVTAAADPMTYGFPTQTKSDIRLHTKVLSEEIDKLNNRNHPRTYASVSASPTNTTLKDPHKEHTCPVAFTKTHKHGLSQSGSRATLIDERFLLQLETRLDAETSSDGSKEPRTN